MLHGQASYAFRAQHRAAGSNDSKPPNPPASPPPKAHSSVCSSGSFLTSTVPTDYFQLRKGIKSKGINCTPSAARPSEMTLSILALNMKLTLNRLTWTSYRGTFLRGRITTILWKATTAKTTVHSVQKSTDLPDTNVTTKVARAPPEVFFFFWQGKLSVIGVRIKKMVQWIITAAREHITTLEKGTHSFMVRKEELLSSHASSTPPFNSVTVQPRLIVNLLS